MSCALTCENQPIVTTSYYNDRPVGNSVSSSIDSFSDELLNMHFPKEVVQKSNSILYSLKIPIKRNKLWRIIMCYCVDKAYIELNNIQDVYDISSCLGLGQSEIPKMYDKLFWSNKKFLESLEEHIDASQFNIMIYVMPEVFITEYYNLIIEEERNPENTKNKIEMMRFISNHLVKFVDERPQIIALATIRVCLKRWNMNWNQDAVIDILKKLKKPLANVRNVERILEKIMI